MLDYVPNMHVVHKKAVLRIFYRGQKKHFALLELCLNDEFTLWQWVSLIMGME